MKDHQFSEEERKEFRKYLEANGLEEAWKLMPVGLDTVLGSEYFVISKSAVIKNFLKNRITLETFTSLKTIDPFSLED